MFFLSWLTALGSGTGSVCLMTETDSPVKMDWSIRRVVDRICMIRISAGILSPTRGRKKKNFRQIHSNLKPKFLCLLGTYFLKIVSTSLHHCLLGSYYGFICWGCFHKRSTSSFYTCRTQMDRKTLMTSTVFLCFGSAHVKAPHKFWWNQPPMSHYPDTKTNLRFRRYLRERSPWHGSSGRHPCRFWRPCPSRARTPWGLQWRIRHYVPGKDGKFAFS